MVYTVFSRDYSGTMKIRLGFFLASFLALSVARAEMRTWTFEPTGDLAALTKKDRVQLKGADGSVVIVWKTNLTFQGEMVALASNKVAVVKQPDGKVAHIFVGLSKTKYTDDGCTLLHFITNKMVIIRRPSGDMFQPLVSNLSQADRDYVARIEADLPRIRREQALLELQRKGYIEFSRSTLMSSPEKLAGNKCWFDAAFEEVDSETAENPEAQLKFSVRDKSGTVFSRCRAPRNGKVDVALLALQPGDKARFLGVVVLFPTDLSGKEPKFDPNQAELMVDKVEPEVPVAGRKEQPPQP
jgi:hypothetical protein